MVSTHVVAVRRSRIEYRSSLLTIAAIWAAALFALAEWLPAATVLTNRAGAQPRWSLVHYYGFHVLTLVAIPLATVLVVATLLWLGARGLRAAWWLAMVLACCLVAASLVGFVTILVPILAVPVGGFLVAACAVSNA